ncbi:MAG: sensor histidine kinase [Hominilimicola sp.]
MFKKLRNKLLIVNTLIIAALVLGSFSVIYVMTARNVSKGVEQKLERAIGMQKEPRPKDNKKPPKEDNKSKQEDNIPPEPRNNESGNEPFSLTFTVITDAEGNIEKINIPFDLNEDFYSDKMMNIIHDADNEGRIRTNNGYWAYKVSPIDMGYVTAFTEFQAEHTILRNLFLILLLVGIFALTAAFLISLFSANRSIRPVEESYNRQKQFVADASHELKTPLTTINTNVDVLLSHPDSTIGEERKWLDYIKTESERMTKLTNDLLYLAKLDHNEGGIMLSRVSFSEAAESVILLMEAVIFENNVNLLYDITPDLYVNGSSEQLKQLVMILLDNAVKYTPKSGDIKIILSRDSSDAVFTIRNSGEGISDEAQKQIFERFYREDKSRARASGGYGLGLAIARAIVDSCKGSIDVESVKNEYTEFTVRIPISK